MEGHSEPGTTPYVSEAERLGIPPGLVYLRATGYPADSSTPVPELGSRAQALVNPREVNPTTRGDVHAWMRRMAYSDASMRTKGDGDA